MANKKIREELESILNLILEQNYLQHNNQFYKLNEGLSMGALTSAILAEIFIQYLEHIMIYKTLQKHQIIDYYRYVDDILIIYNAQLTNIDKTIDEFNKIHPKIKFTIEKETENKINYLDLMITEQDNKLTYAIYRKPTTTDSILHNDSCHPTEQKISHIISIKPHEYIPFYKNKQRSRRYNHIRNFEE
jgi:hypothetical protein